jgi:hypothetical protein
MGTDRALRLVRLAAALMPGCSWGKNWGKVPDRFQPISADLEFAKTA